jgi:membrane associated rhomboid family serine protease
MLQASVGFHCPECTRSQGQRVYTARSLASRPIVTQLLIAANVAVFVAGLSGGDAMSTGGRFLEDGGLVGEALTRTGELVGVAHGEWWRIVTSGFLHAGLLHLGFNMLALFNLGMMLEPAIGRARFGVLYGASLLSGSLGVLVVDPNAFTVGASGAVFGMMGAAMAAYRARGIDPFSTGIGGVVVLNLIITFAIPRISIGGHVGGLLGGMICGWILLDVGPKAFGEKSPVPLAIVVGLAALFAGASLTIA